MSVDLSQHRILVIDDNPAIHDDFRKVLRTTGSGPASSVLDEMESALFGEAQKDQQPIYEIDTASQGEQGLAKVKAALAEGRPYSMIFVDMRMPPGWDGVQTLREIWKVAPTQQAAICTAYSDYTPEQIARELGVNRRMVIVRKPFDGAEVRQLAAMICDKASVSLQRLELEKVVESRVADLKHAANHDGLTGLANRRLFADSLARSLSYARRNPSYRFAVLFIDCDNFKTINDTLGHHAGDALLLQISQRLQGVLRSTDTIGRVSSNDPNGPVAARIGGDEFAILLSGIRDDVDAARVAERLLAAAAEPYTLRGRQVRSGMSVGITTNSIQYTNPDDMLRDADMAMYQAKRGGRARYVLFDQAMHDAAVVRLTAEAELRSAVETGQIRPYYQPIIDTDTRLLVGFEALARWEHPTRGTILPADFIPLAEETGIILLLGSRILEDACQQLVLWRRNFPSMAHLTMSVNVSRKQLSSPNLAEQVIEIVRRTQVSPKQLKLEITESAMMENAHGAIEVLQQLRAADIQLQMDDFGTGYSSLSCLQNFPLQGLKIDRTFMGNVSNEAGDKILNAITTLAHGLKMPLVAEGVETQDQFEHLQALGCDYAQGYLFARPMDSDAATAFLMGIAASVSRAA